MTVSNLIALIRHLFAPKKGNTENAYTNVVSGAIGVFFVKITTMVLSLLVAICLARVMGAAEYGVFAYIFTVSSTLALVGRVGTDVLNVREVSVKLEDKNYRYIRGLLVYGLNITLFLSAALMALFILYLHLVERQNTFASVAWYAVFLAPLVGLLKWQESIMRALKNVVRAQVPDAIFRPVVFLFCIGTAYVFFGSAINADVALLMCVVSLLTASIYGFWQLRRHLPMEVLRAEFGVYFLVDWFKSSLLICGVGLSAALSTQLPSLILGMYVQGDELGVYFVCVRVANLMTFVFLVFNVALGPYAARMFRDGDARMMGSVSTKVVVASLLITFPVVVFGYFQASLLLSVFGADFAAGELYLRWLILANYFAVAAGSGYLWLVVSKNEKYGFYVSLATVIFSSILCFLLIPKYGALGAVLCAAMNIIVFNFLNAIFVKRLVGFDPTVFGVVTNKRIFKK